MPEVRNQRSEIRSQRFRKALSVPAPQSGREDCLPVLQAGVRLLWFWIAAGIGYILFRILWFLIPEDGGGSEKVSPIKGSTPAPGGEGCS